MSYYVYTHSTSEGVIKYVGSGVGGRSGDRGNRSDKWKSIFNKQEFIVKHIVSDLTKEEARQLEQFFINKFRETVVNTVSVSSTRDMIYEDFCEVFEIDYKSETGLVYKIQNNGTGKNKRMKGEVAGTLRFSRGKYYWYVKLKGRPYACHRIVYLLHNKNLDATSVINHVDNNGKNNNIANLEQVTMQENSRKKSLINRSGHVNIQENIRKGVLKGYTFFGKAYGLTDKYFSTNVYGDKIKALDAAVAYKSIVLLKLSANKLLE